MRVRVSLSFQLRLRRLITHLYRFRRRLFQTTTPLQHLTSNLSHCSCQCFSSYPNRSFPCLLLRLQPLASREHPLRQTLRTLQHQLVHRTLARRNAVVRDHRRCRLLRHSRKTENLSLSRIGTAGQIVKPLAIPLKVPTLFRGGDTAPTGVVRSIDRCGLLHLWSEQTLRQRSLDKLNIVSEHTLILLSRFDETLTSQRLE